MSGKWQEVLHVSLKKLGFVVTMYFSYKIHKISGSEFVSEILIYVREMLGNFGQS